MPRYVRVYLIACIALAFGHLVVHAGEPLRLSVGDPWTDASVVTMLAKLVGAHLTLFRSIALLSSGLGAWLLFQYARRMWNDTVAIVATALATTSMLWMTFADSLHRPPVMFATCFLALWGVVRALESGLRRHYLAALVGTFACLFAASNDWLFLPLGVLFTVHVKRGELLGRTSWRVLAVCCGAALLAMVLRSPVAAHAITWQSTLDHRALAAPFATLARRYTVMFTPLFWITLGWALWRGLRASSVTAAIADGTTWMLVAALLFSFLPPPSPESVTLRSQLLLPFYAIGSALLVARLFEHGGRLGRVLALTSCLLAPLWGLGLAISHPREVLDRDDLSRANEYLARNDGNSFVISNLLEDGPIQAGFGRHGWPALHDQDLSGVMGKMLELFETTGTDYVHAIIFTTPGSRFVDRSIAQVLGRQMASVDGWPDLVRRKVNELVEGYDRRVLRALDAVGAERVLHLGNFDIYRIDRAKMLEVGARSLPVVQRIDFDSLGALRHQLLGWGDPTKPTDPRPVSSSIAGYARCRNPLVPGTKPAPDGCTVVEGTKGLEVLDVGWIRRAELVVRIERACDQQLTITFAAPAQVDVAVNGATVLSCGDPRATLSVRVSQDHVHPGLDIIALEDVQGEPKRVRPEVKSVMLAPLCP